MDFVFFVILHVAFCGLKISIRFDGFNLNLIVFSENHQCDGVALFATV